MPKTTDLLLATTTKHGFKTLANIAMFVNRVMLVLQSLDAFKFTKGDKNKEHSLNKVGDDFFLICNKLKYFINKFQSF